MRVKVGDQWFGVGPAQAILVELSEADKRNIAAMIPGATMYACFDDADPRPASERLDWMDGGPVVPSKDGDRE